MSNERPETVPTVDKDSHILIDRVSYPVEKRELTGTELRMIPKPPIGPDRDLWQVIPGGTDRKISDSEVVEIHNGERFFTAPSHINPGMLTE